MKVPQAMFLSCDSIKSVEVVNLEPNSEATSSTSKISVPKEIGY